MIRFLSFYDFLLFPFYASSFHFIVVFNNIVRQFLYHCSRSGQKMSEEVEEKNRNIGNICYGYSLKWKMISIGLSVIFIFNIKLWIMQKWIECWMKEVFNFFFINFFGKLSFFLVERNEGRQWWSVIFIFIVVRK